MSSRSGRSDNRQRFHVQNGRQEWIPKSVTADTATVMSSSSAVNDRANQTNKESSRSHHQPPPISRNRGNSGQRVHTNQVSNQRRKERETEPDQRKHEERETDSGEKKGSKSASLPQLLQEIQDKLLKGTVECMICYDMVRRSAHIWSCSSCYSIFHLHCIKKWVRAPTSIDSLAEKNQGFNWRCPGCQSVQLISAREIRYSCFCGKRQDPPTDLYLTPHSCGEHCGKQLEKEVLGSGTSKEDLCPHVCVLQCHPGPCPPCRAFASPRLCPCGKKTITTRCSERKSVLTCWQRCEKPLECRRHECDRVCHVGSCDNCRVLINASCFCKKKIEVVICGEMEVKGEVNVNGGLFSCDSVCGKKLDCGKHFCTDTCHPGPCGDCELLPNKIRTCYCGKTQLVEQRRSCLDPIPCCSQRCEKILHCGLHHCKDTCHEGICGPCTMTVTQKCRCGSTLRTVECYKTALEAEIFTCDRICGRKKNCGRHRCSEKCCPLSDPKSSISGEWDPHLCSMPCEKKLRCGQHSCESLCHSGHCPPCLETIFTDLTCACGRSSIPPPLPCGTPPPSCQYSCSVPQPCGHASTHSCHFGDCPPCSVPIAKECIGGHVVLRNIPCGSKDIRCNKICGKTRQCGMHACARTCHPVPCDSCSGSGSELGSKPGSCGQTCGAPRRDCRHTCTSLCHPGTTCPDVRCEFPVTITCSCGRISASVMCDAGGSSSGGYNVDSVFEALVIQKLPSPLLPVEVNGSSKKVPLGQRKLICDEECSKLERKRVLADAFRITTPNLDAPHFGEGSAMSELIADLFRRDPKWVLAVEERCKALVLGKGKNGASGLRVHVFCHMLKEKRDAVRLIVERWKLSINAAGREPKQFIIIHATQKSKAPARILSAKRSNLGNPINPPVLDPLVDMDPRLVVSLFDLPSDADVSALVLRFGGECELVWLNDKNALAVFGDPARAATAMRRLDHGSVYHGAAVLSHGTASNAWGATSSAWGATSNAWKKAVVQEKPEWRENSWGVSEDWTVGSGSKEFPLSAALANKWSVLDSEANHIGAISASFSTEESGKCIGSSVIGFGQEAKASSSSVFAGGKEMEVEEESSSDVVEDWENAYE